MKLYVNPMPAMRLLRMGNLAFIGLFQVILRLCIVLPILSHHGIEPSLSDDHFAMLVLATMFIAASGNVINDYFDQKTDSINRPERIVVGKHINRRTALLLHVVFTLVGTFMGLYVSFVIRKASLALMFIIIPVVLWFYSTLFKKQMLVGNIIVAFLTALTAFLVAEVEISAIVAERGSALLSNAAISQAWLYTSAYAFFALLSNLAREIIKDMEDVDGDAAIGCRTLPIEMGIGYSKSIVVMLEALLAIATLIAYGASDMLQQVPGMLAYICIAIVMPTAAVCFTVVRGTKSKHFHLASTICKVAMLMGALAAPYIYFWEIYFK